MSYTSDLKPLDIFCLITGIVIDVLTNAIISYLLTKGKTFGCNIFIDLKFNYIQHIFYDGDV